MGGLSTETRTACIPASAAARSIRSHPGAREASPPRPDTGLDRSGFDEDDDSHGKDQGCDDDDAAVNPAVVEDGTDDIDHDCDALTDAEDVEECPAKRGVEATGLVAGGRAGRPEDGVGGGVRSRAVRSGEFVASGAPNSGDGASSGECGASGAPNSGDGAASGEFGAAGAPNSGDGAASGEFGASGAPNSGDGAASGECGASGAPNSGDGAASGEFGASLDGGTCPTVGGP